MAREFRPYTSAIPMETKEVTLFDMASEVFAIDLRDKLALLMKGGEVDLGCVWVGRYETHCFQVDPVKALADMVERAQLVRR